MKLLWMKSVKKASNSDTTINALTWQSSVQTRADFIPKKICILNADTFDQFLIPDT